VAVLPGGAFDGGDSADLMEFTRCVCDALVPCCASRFWTALAVRFARRSTTRWIGVPFCTTADNCASGSLAPSASICPLSTLPKLALPTFGCADGSSACLCACDPNRCPTRPVTPRLD